MAVAKKHRSYPIDFKIKIFEEIDNKMLSKAEICKKYYIPNSTLSTFLRTGVKSREKTSMPTGVGNVFMKQPTLILMKLCTDVF